MIYIVLFFISFFFVRFRLKFYLLSVVNLFYLFYAVVIVLSIIYQFAVPMSSKFNMAHIDEINNKQFFSVIYLYFKTLFFFNIGVFFTTFLIRNTRETPKVNFELTANINDRYISYFFSAIVFIVSLLIFLFYSPEIFYREKYIPTDLNAIALQLIKFLLLVSVIVLPFYKGKRYFTYFGLLFVLLVGLSFGSRVATIYLVIYIALRALQKNNRQRISYLILLAPLLLLFYSYNLILRQQDQHGLVPYLSVLIEKPGEVLENVFFNIYYTFIFGTYVTYQTLEGLKNVSYSNLGTLLSPLPGKLTNWYEIYKSFRINSYMPYNAIGEIASFKGLNFVYYIFLGFWFSVIDSQVKKLITSKKLLLALVLMLLATLYIIFSVQYNLRSSFRIIYYSMTFLLLIYLTKDIRLLRKPRLKDQNV